MLVAPLLENVTERNVYLPPGQWIDYQTGKTYNEGWHTIKAGPIPVVVLVHDVAVIPHIKLAQSTMQMDWSNLELVVYSTNSKEADGLVCLPSDNILHKLSVDKKGGGFVLASDPLQGKVKWKIRAFDK